MKRYMTGVLWSMLIEEIRRRQDLPNNLQQTLASFPSLCDEHGQRHVVEVMAGNIPHCLKTGCRNDEISAAIQFVQDCLFERTKKFKQQVFKFYANNPDLAKVKNAFSEGLLDEVAMYVFRTGGRVVWEEFNFLTKTAPPFWWQAS